MNYAKSKIKKRAIIKTYEEEAKEFEVISRKHKNTNPLDSRVRL